MKDFLPDKPDLGQATTTIVAIVSAAGVTIPTRV
ncbi:hypothetical protein ACVIGB_000591 [Bradyrhizobium sp. USDA 4341]